MNIQTAKTPVKPVSLLMAITVVLTLSYSRPTLADTFQCGAGDVSCLIASINQANANGRKNTIRLAAGTYSLTFNNDTDGPNGLPVITSKLTIEGAGANLTIVERASNAPVVRLLYVAKTGDLTLDQLSLTTGRSSGALLNNGGVTNIIHTIVTNNSGALSNNGGRMNIIESVVSDNFIAFLNNGGVVKAFPTPTQ
jgi:hypothetical protein